MSDWTADPRFTHFWANYHKGQSWFQQHQIAYWKAKALAANYENEQLHYLLQNVCECGATLESLPWPITSDEFNKTNPTATEVQMDRNDVEDDYEMEISEDMLEFFAQSMKHKKERREIEDTNQVSYVNLDSLSLETRAIDIFGVNIPDHKSREEKLESYKHLYGDKADRINAMETAMQCTFHRNCDLKQPKLWPNMPLKL